MKEWLKEIFGAVVFMGLMFEIYIMLWIFS